jgi:hypothetical protein
MTTQRSIVNFRLNSHTKAVCIRCVKSLGAALLAVAPNAVTAQIKPTTTIKVKIETQEAEKRLLLESLQVDGKDLGLNWLESSAGFDYRIVLQIRDETNMRVSWCTERVIVYAADGKELFQFTQGGWSCVPATDSIARGVIERLLRLRPDLSRRKLGAAKSSRN